MPGLDHHPIQESEPEDERASRHNARLGLVLFFIYLATYAAFMLINAFAPEVMKLTLGGVNLAIIYGIGLIVFAVALAVLYLMLCSDTASRGRKPPVEPGVTPPPGANAPGSPGDSA